jgi:protease IV
MSEQPRSRVFLWVLIGGGAFFLFLLAVFTLVYFSVRSQDKSEFGSGFGDKIAVVDVTGVILDPKETVKQIKKYGDDSSIKAIVIHLNTPGGGAAASEEIYRAVRRVRDEKKKRVVASIETVGASGGYYIASGTNKIIANEASIVGSIGVIAEWYNYEELIKWAKLKAITLKAGEFKDTGSPTRDITPVEKQYLQSLIDDMHMQFIHQVAEGRGAKDEDIRQIANGKVWTGKQALGLKLVDQIGDFQAAVMDTAKAVGIKGEPTLVREEKDKKTLADLFFGDISQWIPDRAKMMETHVGFYYLWK